MPIPVVHRSPISATLVAWLGLLLAGSVAAQEATTSPGASPATSPLSSPSAASSPTPGPLDIRPEGVFDVRAFDAWSEGLVEPRPNTTLTVHFLEGGRLEGQTGCGTYFGAYALDEDDLALGVISKGPDACGLKRTEEAAAFSIALDAVTSWLPTSSGLELLDAQRRARVVLERLEPAGLTGDWVIERVAGPRGSLRAPPEGSIVVLGLDVDGTVEGRTGCRVIEGFYSSEADRVAIGPLETVGLPCDGELHRHERRLLDAFDRTILWQRSGSELRLTDGDGMVLMELTEGIATPATPGQ